MQLIDANHDGQPDVAWIDTRGDLKIILANANGRWIADGLGDQGAHFVKRLGVPNPRWFRLADLDNDRDFEILVLPESGNEVTYFEGRPAPQ
jgi:hypothetical protein